MTEHSSQHVEAKAARPLPTARALAPPEPQWRPAVEPTRELERASDHRAFTRHFLLLDPQRTLRVRRLTWVRPQQHALRMNGAPLAIGLRPQQRATLQLNHRIRTRVAPLRG